MRLLSSGYLGLESLGATRIRTGARNQQSTPPGGLRRGFVRIAASRGGRMTSFASAGRRLGKSGRSCLLAACVCLHREVDIHAPRAARTHRTRSRACRQAHFLRCARAIALRKNCYASAGSPLNLLLNAP